MTTAAARSWELLPNGLLVFERDSPTPATSQRLVSQLRVCTDPQCSCRDIGLRAVSFEAVGRDFARAGLTPEGLRSKLASSDAMNAWLDLDAGLLRPDDSGGRAPLSADWLDYVQSQVDGEMLDLLHERRGRIKGQTAQETTGWSARDPGELVAWQDAHPGDRLDYYQLEDDALFLADDLYCVRPECTCNEVRIAFIEMDGDGGGKAIGSARVQLPAGELIGQEPFPGKAIIVDRLWAAVRARHKDPERFVKRKRRMVELEQIRLRASSQSQSPPARPLQHRGGRNDLCPCGSGRKYKRCCA